MVQNKYDDSVFFKKYGQMNRSKQGLAGAGEWQTLEAMLPDFAGKRVLDLGCGYGWHCEYAASHGAKSVIGIDVSEKMLAVAQREHAGEGVRYERVGIEEADFADGAFDVVISSLALHYIASFDEVVDKVWRWLSPNGFFVFSCEHPIFTAQGPQDWTYKEDGSIAHFPVDRYFEQGERQATFLGEQVTKHHRTLTTYVGTLLARGFALTGLAEPEPPQELLETIPDMKNELRRPMMLIISAQKNA